MNGKRETPAERDKREARNAYQRARRKRTKAERDGEPQWLAEPQRVEHEAKLLWEPNPGPAESISFLQIRTRDDARIWVRGQKEKGSIECEDLAILDRMFGDSEEFEQLAESLGIVFVGNPGR